jgi:para-nitrobenzyl esterase
MTQENELTHPSVIAETGYGKVRGEHVSGVRVFRGIPYAQARRFLPPAQPQAWGGYRDCTVTGPRCVQGPGVLFHDPVVGEYFAGARPDRVALSTQPESEDCLNLNVLTPGLAGRRPVMVYIHGGGFSGGSSVLTLFGERFVAEQNVVLVGVNHRLNAFGYLYLGDLSEKYTSANLGQLDLVAALKWVRDNIASFGGDPGNVTIFGESGGGAKICTLMAMPAAKGLFHKAIVESGSLLHTGERAAATALARAVLAGVGLDDSRVDELADVPAADLHAALDKALHALQTPMGIGPVLDGLTLPHPTWDPAAPSESAGVPLLVGNCKDESTLFEGVFPFGEASDAAFQLDETGLCERLVARNIPAGEVDALLALYHRDHPTETPSDLYFRISTDRGARWNAVRQAELKIQQHGAPVYLYSFEWNTPCDDGRLRAFHTAELPLAMRLVAHPEAEQLSRQISGAWAAFARTGKPGWLGLPAWPAYNLEERPTMIFDLPTSLCVNDPDGDERRMLRERPSGSLL